MCLGNQPCIALVSWGKGGEPPCLPDKPYYKDIIRKEKKKSTHIK